MSMNQVSPTLAANMRVRERIAAGRPVVHLAFGEAGLPVHPALAALLGDAADLNSYPPVAGIPNLLQGAAGYFDRRRLPTDPATIVTGPGSKPLLYALMLALDGDLLLPAPSWVSYAAQAGIAGKSVHRVAIPEAAGGIPDPDLLEDGIAAARRSGADPRVLLLTIPDNPTGTVAPAELVTRVCDIARSERLTIVSDEIYRDLSYAPEAFVSPAELYPEGTVITSGLSKNLALGGWRLGFARFPQTDGGLALAGRVTALASEIWSGAAAPVQSVAAVALREPPEIVEYIARGRRLHQQVATAVHRVLIGAGATCRPPSAAFYVYPELKARGCSSGEELAETLLERYDIAALPGAAFGDDPSALRLRMASSLLYGGSDERKREALGSEDPASLPWISEALERLSAALAGLAAG